jgi:hypothetical protein
MCFSLRDIIGKLNVATVRALADPAVQSRIVDLGFEGFHAKEMGWKDTSSPRQRSRAV